MLTEEQAEEIRGQLIRQIEENFPEEKKEPAKEHVLSMNAEQLENFLKQNNLIKTPPASAESAKGVQENIFRLIIKGEVPFYKINENKYALAILEINPVSRGHIIVIPKKAVSSIQKIPQPVFSLAKNLAKKIKTKLKPKEVSIASADILGEFVINVLPVYKNESLNSQRYKADKGELIKLQEMLEKRAEKSIPKKKSKKSEKKELPKEIRLPKRIP